MKILFSFLLSLVCVVGALGQSVLPFRADTIRLHKVDGYAELRLENRTKNVLGIAVNIGNGAIEFQRPRLLQDTLLIIGLDTFNIGVAGAGGGGVTAGYVDSVVQEAIGNINVTIFKDETILGDNTFVDPLRVDSALFPTFYRMYKMGDSLAALIGEGEGGGLTEVAHDGTLFGNGDNVPLGVDSTNYFPSFYRLYKAIDSLAEISGAVPYTLTVGAGLSLTGNGTTIPWHIINTGSPGTNPHNALDIRNFGGVANATFPGSGNNASGTNQTPALAAMYAAAASGQLMIIPNGNWLFSTPLDTVTGKRMNLLVLGDTYHNGSDWLIFKNATGPQDQHRVTHMGYCNGRINIPTQNRTNYLAGTGPNWASFTGSPFKLFNVYQVVIEFNKIEGFRSGVQIMGGGNCSGCNAGSQENTIVGRHILKCAVGIRLTSLDGNSYIDKNVFSGPNHGTMRISGGLALEMDGNPNLSAFNDPITNVKEIYNGAFRSNEFHFLVELVDSIANCNGDITYNEFDITVEGGASTGVFGRGFQMRSVAPNYVLAPKFNGQGVYGSTKLQNGMGINGTINVPIWNGGTYYGNNAVIDEDGNIVFYNSSASKTVRDNAPSNFRFAKLVDYETEVTTSASAYTVAQHVSHVWATASGPTITLPSAGAAGNVGREITIGNEHASASLTVANATGVTTIPAGVRITYRSVSGGASWKSITNLPGTGGGGGGSSIFTADADGYYTPHNIGLGGSNSSSSTAVRFVASTNSKSSFRVPTGAHPSVPVDGDEWRVGYFRYMAWNGFTFEYVTAPTGGTARQVIMRSDDNSQYKHGYAYASLGKFKLVSNAAYVVTDNDFVIHFTGLSANRALTLPSAASYPDRCLILGHAGSFSMTLSTIVTDGVNNINSVANNKIMIISDGTTWRVALETL